MSMLIDVYNGIPSGKFDIGYKVHLVINYKIFSASLSTANGADSVDNGYDVK